METENKALPELIQISPSVSHLPSRNAALSPITVIGNSAIQKTFDNGCYRQVLNARECPGVTEVVLNPDAHVGYGAPIGCVMVSPSHIYPGPVGVDIKCSMSLLQLDFKAADLDDKRLRRAIIDAICERIPTGPGQGQRSVKKSRRIARDAALAAVTEGASEKVCDILGIPSHWASRCEDAFHRGHDGTAESLRARLDVLTAEKVFVNLDEKLAQLGSYGGGNHFGECCAVTIEDRAEARASADVFGLRDGAAAMLSHCGSRGFGNILATRQFKVLEKALLDRGEELPCGDRHLVYAVAGSPEADAYLDDMALGANFSTVNHLLINSLVAEAFAEIIPGISADLIYYISNNIVRREHLDGSDVWVHRKGATRAFPAGHAELAGTPFEHTGHPILLPGNPVAGSAVMVAQNRARLSCFSINHGAGRALGRKNAIRELDQTAIDKEIFEADILTNCRQYPRDEAPAAYKNFGDVLASVEEAGLASTVARLKARFVIKDASVADD